jgi:hypothetical protein
VTIVEYNVEHLERQASLDPSIRSLDEAHCRLKESSG